MLTVAETTEYARRAKKLLSEQERNDLARLVSLLVRTAGKR